MLRHCQRQSINPLDFWSELIHPPSIIDFSLSDQHSLQILRDNANLSLHLRNHPVHLANRVTLLRLRPNERRNWINLAVAYDLNGELEKAEEVLSALADINSVSQKPKGLGKKIRRTGKGSK